MDGLAMDNAADNLFHALDHLGSGFVGESHRENGFRHHPEMLNQMSDAVGDDARLSAPSAGQDEHGAIDGFDGFALLRVEFIEERQMDMALVRFYKGLKIGDCLGVDRIPGREDCRGPSTP